MKKHRLPQAGRGRQADSPRNKLPIKELCRDGGFSDATFYKWRRSSSAYGSRRLSACVSWNPRTPSSSVCWSTTSATRACEATTVQHSPAGHSWPGHGTWHPPHPDPAGAPDAERLHRELRWQVPRRAPQRVLVPGLASGQDGSGRWAAWRTDYTEIRRHSSLGRMPPPARFAELHRQRAGNAAPFPSTHHPID